MSTLTQIVELGEKIYKETLTIRQDSGTVSQPGVESPQAKRLEELRIAGEFNGIALRSARMRADQAAR